tara:strand:+ start:256 stop:2241 length:1986 start_codon:yes stop_codon:yes gene_type:complete
MSRNEQYDSGWVGWKSSVFLAACIFLIFKYQPISVQVKGGLVAAGPVQVETSKKSMSSSKNASKEKKIDTQVVKLDLSDVDKKSILNSIKWTTNTSFPLDGDPRAKKGGEFKQAYTSFPATTRPVGKNTDSGTAMIGSLVYQPLIGINSSPYYVAPGLASHWAQDDDKVSFYFKTDADARWADGRPVVAKDVVATWRLLVDKGIQKPSENATWVKFYEPVELSERVVMVRAKEPGWRNIIHIAEMSILPDHIIGSISGKEFLKKHNWEMVPGSGPYKFESIDKPKRLTLARRTDFWGAKKRQYIGQYNFDKIVNVYVEDQEIIWEKFKKGEFDFMPIYRSQRWVKGTSFDKVKNGWIQKVKVFNRKPRGTQGFDFNLRKPPFDDIRMRKAFAHLWNRELLMEKLMFNEYDFMDSFFQNATYMGKNVTKIRYDPEKAIGLLKEAGYALNSDGFLAKNGKPLKLTFEYVGKWSEKFYTIFQEDLKKVGIQLEIKEVTWATKLKNIGELNFRLSSGAFGASAFPDPRILYHSSLAEQKQSYNRWGIKNDRIDQLIELYDAEYDASKRSEYLAEMDDILTRECLKAFDWYAPAERLIYWNKFSYPPGVLNKTSAGDYRDAVTLWWYDEDKAKALKLAMETNTKLASRSVDEKFWMNNEKYDFIHD